MVEEKILEIVNFLEQILKNNKLNVSKIILFGSTAKEKAIEDSDLDLVIVSEDFSDKNIFERANLTKEAEIKTIRKFMIPLDIITLTQEELDSETSLISQYIREGKVVFEAA